MKKLLLIMMIMRPSVMEMYQNYTAEEQIVVFKKKTKVPIGIITTINGAQVEYKDATTTLNKRLIINAHFMDTITHLNRERISERVVHAKGAGAFGYFEVTQDITDICKAELFSAVGKKTPVTVRFSSIDVEMGGIDTSREPRGFAVKFHTKEGDFDIVGLNTPMFALKDPLLFPSLVRARKRNPATHLKDVNMFWDYITLHPESLTMFLIVFSDRGVPEGYRHMPGFGIHTFQVVNQNGDSHFVRFHFHPDAGIRNLLSDEATEIAGTDPDYATRDLFNAIGTGNFPGWEVGIQVLTVDDVKNAKFNVFDVTKLLPLDDYPLRPFGKLVLNRNPKNNFADMEQLAFSPANLVLGILGAPDKVFESRRLSYRDSQYYRLGANFYNIPVNCPMRSKPLTYNRDGVPSVLKNYGGIPNYYPNSFNGPIPCKDPKRVELIAIKEDDSFDFDQAREIYLNDMTADERNRTIENILASLGGATSELQDKAVKLFSLVDPELGNMISEGLQES